MQAWLSVSGVDIATIGFLSLVGLPYTFKFLWAPLMDRFELPWLGRRRGWLVLTQLLLAGALLWMAATSPSDATRFFALLAVLVAFLSASQDVVIDAYRTDALHGCRRLQGRRPRQRKASVQGPNLRSASRSLPAAKSWSHHAWLLTGTRDEPPSCRTSAISGMQNVGQTTFAWKTASPS